MLDNIFHLHAAMNFFSDYQYDSPEAAAAAAAAAGKQPYSFLEDMHPTTTSHAVPGGSTEVGRASTPHSTFDAALAGEDFASYDYGAADLGPPNSLATAPFPTSPPAAAHLHHAAAFAAAQQQQQQHMVQHHQAMPGHSEQQSPEASKGNSDDDDLTPAQSRRKAQNRAAQRAFRERKEKHVKDLESKLANLENSQQQASVENERLRRHLQKVSTENEILRATSNMNNQSSAPSHHQNHHQQQQQQYGGGHRRRASSPPSIINGPTEYRPTDFYASLLRDHASKSPSHRIIMGDDGERLLAPGATWDLIVSHELYKRGLVNISMVSERLRDKARCDGQGPVFPESAIMEAIMQSVASGSDDLL
ncbi:hypothetical protein BB8028_0005g09010 [Beauveria bassiana]|uniref:BZIP domain-containing protein n=3 Tax=Beauveria bassiana TaxID=176275 RepID=A0A2S7YGT5_BEABA|nr:hypothetical protein BB8028_0005g09010 [Beauveria bassiana]